MAISAPSFDVNCKTSPSLKSCYVPLEKIPPLTGSDTAVQSGVYCNAIPLEEPPELLVRSPSNLATSDVRKFSKGGSMRRMHCNKGKKGIARLATHKLIRTRDKRYKCDMCGSSFSRSDHLKRHKSRHTGEKPYTCDLCSFSFSRPDHLKRHKSRHAGEKAYRCDVCGFSLSRLEQLKIHKRRHTG